MTRDGFPLDAPGPVRRGEELDLAALDAYLVRVRPELEGPLEVEQFRSGYSNLTYLVRKGPQEMVLRRPPRGAAIKSAHDMAREHRILAALIRVWPKVPRPIALCEDPGVLGAPFYLMERVRGVIPRGKAAGLAGAGVRALSESLVDTLAELHRIDCHVAGLMDLGRPEGYVERQVKGWSGRYADARTDDVPSFEGVVRWLEAHRPRDAPPALVHNDYKHDNVVLDPAGGLRIVAVLDWEMATIGHPLLDIGTTLAYWVDPDDSPAWRGLALTPLTAQPGSLSRAEVFERHARAMGAPSGDPVFAYAFGLFKVAVIAQQIYARYRQGLTADARFAGLGAVVRACGDVAERAIARRRIDRLGD